MGILNDLLSTTIIPTVGAEAVRYSLLSVAVAKLLAIALFLLAARTLHEDMKAGQRQARGTFGLTTRCGSGGAAPRVLLIE